MGGTFARRHALQCWSPVDVEDGLHALFHVVARGVFRQVDAIEASVAPGKALPWAVLPTKRYKFQLEVPPLPKMPLEISKSTDRNL